MYLLFYLFLFSPLNVFICTYVIFNSLCMFGLHSFIYLCVYVYLCLYNVYLCILILIASLNMYLI